MELIHSKAGEIAALSTAILWAFTATFFTLAGRRIGSNAVNLLRLVLATAYLLVSHWLIYGSPVPDLSLRSEWFYLGISGAIGLALGDSLLFQSFLDLGTQKAMVIMSSWPIFSSLMAFFFFGESLNSFELTGIILTISGISIVIAAKVESVHEVRPVRGVVLALGGAICQAVGILLAKEGLMKGLPSLSGTVMRMVFATITMVIFSICLKALQEKTRRKLDPKGLMFAFFGSIVGPFLGVWLSLYAVAHAKVGVASALMTTSPVLLIPLSAMFLGDKLRKSVILGTFITVIGSVLLFVSKG